MVFVKYDYGTPHTRLSILQNLTYKYVCMCVFVYILNCLHLQRSVKTLEIYPQFRRQGNYNSSVRITNQLLTPFMLCVLILYMSGGSYSFKVDSERQIFEKLLMAVLNYSQSFCQKSAERKSPKNIFVFCFDIWFGARTLALRLISHNTTYQTTATSCHQSYTKFNIHNMSDVISLIVILIIGLQLCK